jgi:hypothetical protein
MAWPIYEVINAPQDADHLPHRPQRHRLGHALRRRLAAGVQQPDAPGRRGDRFPRHADRHGASQLPWQDEALSVATHKPNVWIDLSGWSPKYFPKQLVQYANTLLKDRILFGSDYPLITPERWMKDFEDAGFKPEVMPGILKGNAVRLLWPGLIRHDRQEQVDREDTRGWTTPCSTVVRPVLSEKAATSSDSTSSHRRLDCRCPESSVQPVARETMATAGIVNPMLASAEPSRQVQAGLQAVGPGCAQGGEAFGQQHTPRR